VLLFTGPAPLSIGATAADLGDVEVEEEGNVVAAAVVDVEADDP
jgi:hypothetical protein